MVSVAEMENVTGVDMMVQSLLYQVLGLESRQLRHSGSTQHKRVNTGESEQGRPKVMKAVQQHPAAAPILPSSFSTSDLVSKKMSLKSRLARNMNMLLKSLISVTPLGGREWPTATRPTVW